MNRNVCKRLVFTALVFIVFLICLTGCTESVSLALVSAPDKTVYEFGEDLDLTGGKLRLTISGVDLEVPMKENPNVSYLGYDSYVLGEQTVSVVYRYAETDLTVTFSVSVKERTKKETGIRVVTPNKYSYIEGQPFEAKGMKVFLKFEDGTEVLLMEGFDLSVGETVNLSDNGAVVVTYNGFRASFRIQVEERRITDLIFVKEPSKKEYLSGESPDLSDAEIAYRYNDGSIETVSKDTELIVLPEVFRFGDQSVTVKDASRGDDFPTLTFEVSVKKKRTVEDRSEFVKNAISEIPNAIESAAAYENLYLDTGLSWETFAIDGKTYSDLSGTEIDIDAESALNLTLKAFLPAGASDAPKLRIHLYALLALGSNTVTIETSEEILEIVLGKEPASEYRFSGERLVFTDGNAGDVGSVVHMFSDAGGKISAYVRKPMISLDSERYVKIPPNVTQFVVWRDNAVARELEQVS